MYHRAAGLHLNRLHGVVIDLSSLLVVRRQPGVGAFGALSKDNDNGYLHREQRGRHLRKVFPRHPFHLLAERQVESRLRAVHWSLEEEPREGRKKVAEDALPKGGTLQPVDIVAPAAANF